MAAFNFPNSPNTNDTHTENGISFKWDGTVWKRVSGTGAQGPTGATGEEPVAGFYIYSFFLLILGYLFVEYKNHSNYKKNLISQHVSITFNKHYYI